MNKDRIMLDYLVSCPSISDKSLFFNYAEGQDDTNHFVTQATDVKRNIKYVDGSEEKIYSFSLIAYKSLGTQAVDKSNVESDENLDELTEVQTLIDWITEQSETGEYPNFGESCQIDTMYCTTDKPVFMGAFTDTVGTPTAKYSMTIVIEYLDTTKKIWKN